MITVLRLHWASVDDAQWSAVQSRLNTKRLAPHGCLSWHIRHGDSGVRVTALWDNHYGAQRFVEGHLVDVLRAAGLSKPEITRDPVRGLHFTGHRPTVAQAA